MNKLSYKITKSKQRLSSRTGLIALQELMNHLGFSNLIDNHFPQGQSNRSYAASIFVQSMMHQLQCTPQEIKTKILELYPNDNKFLQAFSDKSIPTKQSNKKARYLLARLAEQTQSAQPSIDETTLTVEHILPLNPNNEWCDYFGNNWQLFNERIGNMALTTSKQNKELDQKTFQEKQTTLTNTHFAINKNLKDYNQWDSNSIESRQTKLAKKALNLWRIN